MSWKKVPIAIESSANLNSRIFTKDGVYDMPLMLIIDLDETVLSTRPTLLNSNVNLTPSVFNPYGGSDVCYTLNKIN